MAVVVIAATGRRITVTDMTATQPLAGGDSDDGLLPLTAVAELIERDLSTVKRYLRDGRWQGARQDRGGRRTWRVPFDALVAAGDIEAPQAVGASLVVQLRREPPQMQALREEVVRLQERLRAAEELSRERAETIALLRTFLPH